MGKVIAVCTSPAKGTQKTNVGTANFIADWGIENDAHAGHWHRQVSLLSFDKIEAFRARGAQAVGSPPGSAHAHRSPGSARAGRRPGPGCRSSGYSRGA